METRGCEATEASCGPVFSNSSLFYISAVLVTGIIIIKCPLGTWHNDNFGGKKLDHKGTHACTIKIGPHMLGGVTALLTTSTHSCVST